MGTIDHQTNTPPLPAVAYTLPHIYPGCAAMADRHVRAHVPPVPRQATHTGWETDGTGPQRHTHTQQHQCDRSLGSYAQSRRAAVAGGLRFALCPLLLLKKLSIAAFSGPGPEVPWWRTPRPFALASVGEIGPKPGGISPARFLHTLINHILRHVMSDRNLNAIAFVVLVLTPFGDACTLLLVAYCMPSRHWHIAYIFTRLGTLMQWHVAQISQLMLGCSTGR